MIISIVLLAFLTSLAVQVPQIPAVSKGYPLVKLKSEDKQKTQVIEQAKIIVPYCLMIVVYLFLMNKIGYIASTVVFMLASLIYLKLNNKVLMVILTVALTVVVYFVFTNFLTVILPRGSWFNIAF